MYLGPIATLFPLLNNGANFLRIPQKFALESWNRSIYGTQNSIHSKEINFLHFTNLSDLLMRFENILLFSLFRCFFSSFRSYHFFVCFFVCLFRLCFIYLLSLSFLSFCICKTVVSSFQTIVSVVRSCMMALCGSDNFCESDPGMKRRKLKKTVKVCR
jgi:hypothetical protein